MTKKPVSPLRQRMLDDMAMRNMSPNTMKVYTSAVANFSALPDKRIDHAFREMCSDPFSGDVKSLRSANGALHRRVGDWRILFDLHQRRQLIVVLAVRRRGSKTH